MSQNSPENIKDEKPNSDALKHFMDAQLYISQNNYPMAIIELQDALRLDPKVGSIHVSLAESLWKIGKVERAEEHLLSAIALNGKDTEARKILANQYVARHEYEKANEQFKVLSTIEPKNAEYINAQAELALIQMQFEKTIILFKKAYEVDPSQISSLEQAAEIAIRSKQSETARDIYKMLVQIDPRNIDYLSAYADLLMLEENYDLAEEIIKEMLDVEGNPKERIFQTGVILYQKGQIEKSLKYFQQAIQLDPENLDILHFLISTYLELDQIDSADVYSEIMMAVAPDDSRGFINKSLVLLNQNNYEEVINLLRDYSDQFNLDFAIQYLLGNSYYQKKDYNNSLIYLNRALAISPDSRNVQHTLAIINDVEKQWTKSDSLYLYLIQSDSTDAQALNNYAYSLGERNVQLELALEYASKAITLAPENAAYLDTYGWIFFKLGNQAEALTYINRSIDLDSTNSVVLEHYGDVLLSVDRKSEAIKYYKEALEINPENELLKQKILSE